jgi:TPR repeat protein
VAGALNRLGDMRWVWLAICLSCSVSAGGALAMPQDDYLRGQQAYHRGDVVAAMTALRPAAEGGHAPSQSLLAFILDRADFVDEAAQLYRNAAAQGDAEGHAGLANAYLGGRGVAKDEKQAVAHFSKAADLGHGPSIEVMAAAWSRDQMGLHASADPAAARAALLRAAAQGHLASIDTLATAYAKGGYGLAPDAAESARWQARASDLRKQRAGKPPGKAPK